MEVGQIVRVNLLLFPDDCRYDWPGDRLAHHSGCLGLEKFPDRYVRVDLAHVGVVAQHFICYVFGYLFIYVGDARFLAGRELVPVLLLLFLRLELLQFLLRFLTGNRSAVRFGAEIGHFVVVFFPILLLPEFPFFFSFIDPLHFFVFPVFFLFEFLDFVFQV